MIYRVAPILFAAIACGGARTVPAPPAVDPVAIVDAATATATAPDAAIVATRVVGGTIAVQILPRPAYVELADHAQLVNCDLQLTNATGVGWRLDEIEVTVRDRSGAIAWRKFLSGNGVSPSITTVPNRELAAGAEQLLLNPLPAFPRDLVLATLDFELVFARLDADETLRVTASVAPIVPPSRTALRLPLAGRMVVWDGHDFLSHHRRWDYVFAPIRALGFTSNAARYSYDLVPVDDHGAMFAGDRTLDASWFGLGRPVLAPAAGTVIAVVDAMPDDHNFDLAALKDDLLVVYGNRVLIDHGGREISMLAHLQQGSAKVKVGDRVKAGDVIAAIGASGSAMFPHLHYQLQDGPTGNAEGLPSYFHDFTRVRGSTSVAVPRGAIDSGDFVEPTPRRRP